jgi:hypothetical protein
MGSVGSTHLRTGDTAYDLRQRLNHAVCWLREAEDIARLEMPAWPTADRIREIYEQITEDVLNGKTDVPPLRQRLAEAEADNARLLAAIEDYRLWRPGEKGHAAAHRRLMEVLD